MTNSSSRFGLLLLIVPVLALGLGYMLYQQEQRLAMGVWPDYSLDMMQSIEVSTRKEHYTLMREGSGWVVRLAGQDADAVPVAADPARIEALLSAIAHNRPRQTLDQTTTPVEESQLGFGAPLLQITLKPASGEVREARLTFGAETPTGAAIYAHSSLAPEAVFIQDSSVLHHFDKPADYYFDPRLLDVRGEDVQRLTLFGGHGVQWDMERKDDLFFFSQPTNMIGTSLTASEVRLYVHNLTAVGADVILTTPEKQTPGKPVCIIEMLVPKGPPQRLELYPPLDADQVYGRSTRHPNGFYIDKEKAKGLIRQAYDMQWRGVVNFDSTKVEGARIYSVSSNQTLLMEKSPAGWEERESGRKVSGIDMTLWRLKELRFEAEPVARLGYPAVQRLEFDLLSKDGKLLSTFTFFTDPRLPADQCWLKVGSEEMFYPVTSQLLEDVQGYLPARQQPSGAQSVTGQTTSVSSGQQLAPAKPQTSATAKAQPATGTKAQPSVGPKLSPQAAPAPKPEAQPQQQVQ